MIGNVSYKKKMRDDAIKDKQGLFTIDLINGSKRDGKLGSRMTMQGPVNAEEYAAVSEFMLKLTEMRNLPKANP